MKIMSSGIAHGADRVDVHERVEADPPEPLRRGVAQPQRHPGVGRLVDAQREEQYDKLGEPERQGLGCQVAQTSSTESGIVTCARAGSGRWERQTKPGIRV